MNKAQSEFQFTEGPPSESPLGAPLSELYEQISTLWELPVGQNAHVIVHSQTVDELRGRLELARLPDWPLNRREALHLRIGKFEFSSRHIVSWSLV